MMAFSNPLLLLGLASLPVLWWLLRVTPPRPRDILFPPLRLILDLKPEQKAPARSPWWLTALRLLIAALLITAASGPVLQPQTEALEAPQTPVLLLFDDGWATAPDWTARQALAEHLITRAAQNQQPVVLLPFSRTPAPLALAPPSLALSALKSLAPVPFTPDRFLHLDTIADFVRGQPDLSVIFISDGLTAKQNPDKRPDFLTALQTRLDKQTLTLISPAQALWVLKGRQDSDTSLLVTLTRAQAGKATAFDLVLRDSRERILGRKSVLLNEQDTEAQIDMAFPLDLRRDIARIEIEGHTHAGAVWLSDQGQNRKRVALVSESNAETSKALLSPLTYLTRALSPYAEIRQSRLGTVEAITALLDEHPSMLVLADLGQLPDSVHTKLTAYMEQGGIVLRFASASLALSSDPLVPVPLRRGGRQLGGALAWETPRNLAPFENNSPFAGLPIPDEVTINRQILAEPTAELGQKTWAHLVDGTPVITAAHHGKGLLVLFHISADANWSNLPLSGLFVTVLQKILDMSHQPVLENDTQPNGANRLLPPLRLLDGYGRWQTASVSALPLDAKTVSIATQDHPAGFYGAADAPFAVNVLSSESVLQVLRTQDPRIRSLPLAPPQEIDLRPWLLLLSALLFLLDGIAVLVLQGGVRGAVHKVATLVLLLGIAWPCDPLHAAEIGQKERDSALATRLAYVITGDPALDEFSRQGLTELSAFLSARTALEPAAPVGVDPSQDELGVYPLLYWPMPAAPRLPDSQTIARIDAYMKNGGTILFDTRDAGLQTQQGAPSAETRALQAILSQIAVPPLEPVPAGHVVLKTFFLIDAFVGRYTTGKTYIEAVPESDPQGQAVATRSGDGVSPLLVTSNDLAAAWAAGPNGGGLSLLAQTMPRQREMALRGGANIVMYVLTGNYKSDQVHVPALLERMGR